MDWFECCHHCTKPEKGIGCHGRCRDYKIAKIKNELERRWLLKIARSRRANVSPALRKLEHREFIKRRK
ncbi:MAG: hypothetical protein IKU42_05960 [Oscillospiraceae bacterium]|nr:hypothetical protein [Oscillospiraceae bacterium]